MRLSFLIFIGCFFFLELQTKEIVLQLKCEGTLKGVTIDSRGANKSTNDSIIDNGDILITFFDNESNDKKQVLNFKWGSENRKVKFSSFGKPVSAIHFDGKSIIDKDGYNFRDYHLNLNNNTLYYSRTTVRGLNGSPPFVTSTSVYFTQCGLVIN